MKRVHDHKDEPDSVIGSPVVGNASQSQRRTAGRKRKASGPIEGVPALQRQRTDTPAQMAQPMHVNVQTTQSMAMTQPQYPQASAEYPPVSSVTFVPQEQYPVAPQMQRKEPHHRQRQLYTQWVNQREAIARQMDFVQSPDDEANLQQLSQNIEELRRLSQEARRG